MKKLEEKFCLNVEELDQILGGLEDPIDSETIESCSHCTVGCMIACASVCMMCTTCIRST